MKSETLFMICICQLVCLALSVKISRLKSFPNYTTTASIIGPPCDINSDYDKCTLDNGKSGQCELLCDVPENRNAKICCHVKLPTHLLVYFCCERSSSRPAVGGTVARKREFPYMVALGWFNKKKVFTYDFKCGGVLISKKFVLTAAHCAYYEGIEPVVVLPGGENLTFRKNLLTIETVHVHPEYDDDFVYNDIALVELVGEYRGSTMNLWREFYLTNSSFTALGYGDTTFGGTSSNVLIKVFLNHVTADECQLFYADQDNVPSGITNTQICAKDPKNKMDTCQGDSGGPLIMTEYQRRNKTKEYLIGITSFGQGCASSPPGVYTLLPAFVDWINSYLEQKNSSVTTRARV